MFLLLHVFGVAAPFYVWLVFVLWTMGSDLGYSYSLTKVFNEK